MRRARIEASAKLEAFSIAGEAVLTIEAATAGEKAKQPTFDINAYNGGTLRVGAFYRPVVVDLKGLRAGKTTPILLDHNVSQIVGQGKAKIGDTSVNVRGSVTGEDEHAKKVVTHASHGFTWAASVGVSPESVEFVDAGIKVKVNGQEFTGPINIVRAGRLGEVSFVAIGADETASAKVAANAKEIDMQPFQKWVEAMGLEFDKLTEDSRTKLQAKYDAELAASKEVVKAKEPEVKAADDPKDDIQASIVAERKIRADESKRVGAITKLCAGKHSEIEAKAIEEGWTADATELAIVRTDRPKLTGGGNRADDLKANALVIEAALAITAGVPQKSISDSIPTDKRESVMNMAVSGDMRGYSLHALMDEIIHASGNHYAGSRKSNGYIRTALESEGMILAQGFSTLSLSGILSNVANKALIDAYKMIEVTWPRFCAVRNHGDFKIHTRYRMDSSGAFKKLGPDGELKNVGMTDASYTNQLDTFGAIIALTRQMMINDDLGAFMTIPTMLGQEAAISVERAAWVLLLSNPSSFFSNTNHNYLTGPTSVLKIESLALAEKKFRDQVSNGSPILMSPKFILTGTTLGPDAQNIFDEKVVLLTAGGGSTASKNLEPAKNKMFNKYQPLISPYLDNTLVLDQDGLAITGQSSTRWFMFADPGVRAAEAVAFLNGQQTPVIESAQTNFNTLGMQWRGYLDFGVGMEDPVAAVMSDGA